MQKFLIYITFILLSYPCFSYQLRGTITDENNKAVAYASVYLNKSTYGVSSNLNGEYVLELKNGTYEIVFYCIGFEKQIQTVIIQDKNLELNIQLITAVTQLSEVAIVENEKDHAYEIIKKAIESREQFRYPAQEYSCQAYIRSSLEKEEKKKKFVFDSLVIDSSYLAKEKMNFVESYSDVYFQPPYNVKEIKTAYKDFSEKFESKAEVSFSIGTNKDDTKQTNFVNTNLFKLNIADVNFNFYSNTISIPSLGANPFVSPLSNFAFLSYKFSLEEYFFEDNEWINKIKITPKRTDGALFSGYIYIVNDKWCIKSIDVNIDPAALYIFNQFRVIQKYTNLDDKRVLSHEEFFYNSKEIKTTIIGHTYIQYSNYNLNPQLPNNFFNNEISSIKDDAYDKDSSFWQKVRPITLKEEEQKFISKQDSIENYHKSEQYLWKQDSIVNKHDIWDYLFALNFQNSFKKQSLYILGIIPSANIFGIGGYRQVLQSGYRKEWSKAYRLETSGKLNYGFTNSDLKGNIQASFMYLPKHFGRLHTSYRNEYTFLNSYEAITTTFSMSNYINIEAYTIGHELEIVNGLFVDVQLDYAHKTSIEGLKFDWWSSQLFGENNIPVSFEGYEQLLTNITLKYTPAQKYYTEPYKKIIVGSKFPTFALTYRKGIKGIFNSVADFDFLELHINDNFKIGTWGESKWNLFVGDFLNNRSVLLTEDKFFRGSDPYFFSDPLKSFQLLGPSLHTSNPYFQAHYLHRFNGVLLNKVPFLKKLRLQEVAGAGILMIDDTNFKHAETYVGLEKIFKIKRQLFRFGAYYVAADSNYSNLAGSFKFGIDFYDSFKNAWSY